MPILLLNNQPDFKNVFTFTKKNCSAMFQTHTLLKCCSGILKRVLANNYIVRNLSACTMQNVIAPVLVSRIILVSWIITFWHTSLTTVEEKRLRKTEGNYYSQC